MDFIEFENHDGTIILLNINKISHFTKEFQKEKIWINEDKDTYFLLKTGEYDRIKKELELRSKSQQTSNDSLSKLLENGIAIRLPGPRYGL